MSEPGFSGGAIRHGHYTVCRREDGAPFVLGAGAMGVTYKAWDERLRIEVALKVIAPARLFDRQAQQLFLREARAAARVRHANVACVHFLSEAGSEGLAGVDGPGREAFFYAMEFVDGLPLDAWLRAHGPVTADLALALAGQIAAGLGAIHDAQLVHRDLKPSNLMVVAAAKPEIRTERNEPAPRALPRNQGATPKSEIRRPQSETRTSSTGTGAGGGCGWEVKIIDFGLARSIERPADDAVRTLGFRGTLRYASPEQCEEQRDLDGRADLYALGCILWEMMAGAPPFVADSQRALLNQQVNAAPPMARVAHCPPGLRELLAGLLMKNRRERPARAQEVAERIARLRVEIADSAEIVAGKGSRSTEALGERSRSPTALLQPPVEQDLSAPAPKLPRWFWPAAGAALLAVALTFGVWLWQPSKPARTPGPAAVATLAPAVAVLPFEVPGGTPEDEALADGLHDDLIIQLVKARGLKVISRSSVLRYRGAQRDLPQIAQALRVSSVVEGTVRRAGTRLRISASLIEAASGRGIWGETFESSAGDLFQLQADLAKKIAVSLQARLTPDEDRAIEQRPTRSLVAWAFYQQAREIQRRSITLDLESGGAVVAALEKAVAEDPEFALAQAQLSLVHGLFYWLRIDATPARRAAMEQAARRAQEIDPNLPETHLALGSLYYRIDRDYPAAYQEYKAAEAVRPNDPLVLFSLGAVCRRLALWDEADRAFTAACERAPAESQYVGELALTLTIRHKHALAVSWLERLLGFYPGDDQSREYAARFRFFADGDWQAYRKLFLQLDPSKITPDQQLWFHFVDRNPRAVVERVESGLDGPVRGTPFQVPASYYAGYAEVLLGAPERARPRLERAVEELEAAIAGEAQARTNPAFRRITLAQAQALLGRKEAALASAEAALRESPIAADALDGGNVALRAVIVFAWVGEKERALTLLTHILARPSPAQMRELAFHPMWDALRGEARFTELVRALGSPSAARP